MLALTKLKHHVSNAQLHQIADRGISAIRRLQSLKAEAQEQAAIVVRTLETNASTFAFAFASGYWAQPGKDVQILGIPVDLAGGIAFHLLGFVGGLGRYKNDAHNFGDGALASYVAKLGLKTGVDQAQKHPPQQLASGYGYGGHDASLSQMMYGAR